MNLYVYFLNLIFTVNFIYGLNLESFFGYDDYECIAVNILLGRDPSNDCCLELGITCSNGYVTEM